MTNTALKKRAKRLAVKIGAEMIKLGVKHKGGAASVDGFSCGWPEVGMGFTYIGGWVRETGRLSVQCPCVLGQRYRRAGTRRIHEPKAGFVAARVARLAYDGMLACAALHRERDAREAEREAHENARDALEAQLEPLREKFHGYTLGVTDSLRVSVSVTFATVEVAKRFLERATS